jgi:hypothetical protein
LSGWCIDQAKLHVSCSEFYNAYFVPITGSGKTIKKILKEWVESHIGIIKRDFSDKIKRRVGVFVQQAAHENTQVRSKGINAAYLSGIKTNVRPATRLSATLWTIFFEKKKPD